MEAGDNVWAHVGCTLRPFPLLVLGSQDTIHVFVCSDHQQCFFVLHELLTLLVLVSLSRVFSLVIPHVLLGVAAEDGNQDERLSLILQQQRQ